MRKGFNIFGAVCELNLYYMKLLKYLTFLYFIPSVLSMSNLFAQQQSAPIRFGIVADVQYGDCDTRGQRYYKNSLNKLADCITDFNNQKVQFAVGLGDFIDRSQADLKPITTKLQELNGKFYNTTGNHDYKEITDNKVLFDKLGMPDEYYSFNKGNWRFIMLNTNEVASYSNIEGTWKEKEYQKMLERINTSNRDNAQDWNGGVSSKQLKWLDDQLTKAQKAGEKVLIFSHNPLYPAFDHAALNDQEILDVIGKYACVKCLISGHYHVGTFAYYKDIPCITTEGMIETENENAYGIIELTDNELILTGYGRTKSHALKW